MDKLIVDNIYKIILIANSEISFIYFTKRRPPAKSKYIIELLESVIPFDNANGVKNDIL